MEDVIREVQVLRLRYERLIWTCKGILKPSQQPYKDELREEAENGHVNLTPSPPPPPAYSEIDRVLEKARKLTISNPPSKPRPKPHPPKTSTKQAEAVYKPSLNKKKERTIATTTKSTSNVRTNVKQTTSTEANRRDWSLATPTAKNSTIMNGQISSLTLPHDYKRLKRTTTHLIDVLKQTESHDHRSHDRVSLIDQLSPPIEDEDIHKQVRLHLLVRELSLLNEALHSFSKDQLLITNHTPIDDIIHIKTRLQLLLDRVNRLNKEWLPWKPCPPVTMVTIEDHITYLSLQVQLSIINLCIDYLLPWLHQTHPTDRMYPSVVQTIQTLTDLGRTSFVSTDNYTV